MCCPTLSMPVRPIAYRGNVSCSPPCDLRGHSLLVKDHASAEAARIELTEFDGETNRTNEFVLKAPVTVGEHTWSALCPAVERNGTSYIEASAQISFTAHTTYVVAWDVPSDIVVRERFTIKVGIKCSNGCRLANSEFAIYDHEGTRVAVATLPDKRWPGTAGLYVSEVELGRRRRRACIPGASRACTLVPGFRTLKVPWVSGSELSILPSIWSRSKRLTGGSSSLRGAHVVMHPYRVSPTSMASRESGQRKARTGSSSRKPTTSPSACPSRWRRIRRFERSSTWSLCSSATDRSLWDTASCFR